MLQILFMIYRMGIGFSQTNLSGNKNLDFSKLNESDFKVKENGKGKHPKLYINQTIYLSPF